MSTNFDTLFDGFRKHYRDRLGDLKEKDIEVPGESSVYYTKLFQSKKLKDGNGPRIFHHGKKTEDVIVLTHGYTDSPYYLEAVALGFQRAGVNVIMPLLPGHGLQKPGNALEDKSLDSKWRETISNAVETAALLGNRISVGGFSTGGALSLNKILRGGNPAITGGLFLFSAAIGIGSLNEKASGLNFLQSLIKVHDGAIVGEGRDPFKYPEMPQTGGMEVGQIVNDNNRLLRGGKEKQIITNPVFAAHSVHDQTARFEDLLEFMKDHVENGVTMIIAENSLNPETREREHLEHACLPLQKDIKLESVASLLNRTHEKRDAEDFELSYPPTANPHFKLMMENVLTFFNREVRKIED